MIYNDPLFVILEALYCGNYCDLIKDDRKWHSEMVQYPYPTRIVELLKYNYDPHKVDITTVVELSDGNIVGVKAQVVNYYGNYWNPPDYSTDYNEFDHKEKCVA